MKKCINCNNIIREKDKFCRTCGVKIESNISILFVNIMIFLITISIILMVALFITSYFI